MSDNLVNLCFNNCIGSKFYYTIIKIVEIPVSVEEICLHLHISGYFTFNRTILAFVAAILDN